MRQAVDRFSARCIAAQLVHLFQQPEPMRPDRVAQSLHHLAVLARQLALNRKVVSAQLNLQSAQIDRDEKREDHDQIATLRTRVLQRQQPKPRQQLCVKHRLS